MKKMQLTKSIKHYAAACILFLLLASGIAHASNNVLAQTVTAHFTEATLDEVMWELKRQTDFTFIYSTNDAKQIKVRNLDAEAEEVTEILDKCLQNSGFTYTMHNGVIAIRKTEVKAVAASHPAIQQQAVKIQGVVVDEEGEPVIGASVAVKGTTRGTITNYDGEFSLEVPSNTKLQISYVGMKTLEVDAMPNMRIVLQSDMQALDEVVVVAYGQQRKEAITGAVANIKSEVIERRPVGAAVAALEGVAAGVQVNNAYGEPGSTPKIRIRGHNSINGNNDPLYVINGVPMGGMDNNDLNPADIESITILKDASSAALYGNKAAAGVVLITTKSGKLGEDNVQVQANINQGFFQRGMKDYEKLDAYKWMEAYWLARRNGLYSTDQSKNKKYATWNDANADATSLIPSGLGEDYNIFNKSWGDLYDANGKLTPGTQIRDGYADDLDWYDPMERTGKRGEYNINIRGGSKKTAYYLGAGYLNEEGFTKRSSGKRYSANTKVDTSPLPWLKVGGTVTASYRENDFMDGTSGSHTSYINPFYYARYMSPIYPVHLHDPATGEYVLDKNGEKQYDGGGGREQNNDRHIVWETELNKNKKYNTNVDMMGYADISFLNDFVFTVKGNLNNRNREEKSYDNAIIGDGAGAGRIKKVTYRYQNYMFQQLLNWRRTFNDVHHIEALLGHENYHYNYEYNYLYKLDEKFPGLMELSNFSTMSSMNGYQVGHRTEGYFSRVGYNYDGTYFGEVSFRRDGSSRFHKDHRWGNFWSVGGSWILTHEEFMRSIEWINNMKLRAAYGEVGKENSVDSYAWMALYNSSQNGGSGAAYREQFDASTITWEKTQAFSVALETRLFNRANFSVEYYDKTSKDLLFKLTLPLSVGTLPGEGRPYKYVNFGSVSNRGLEVSMDVDIIRGKDFSWNVGTNLHFQRNKVTDLPPEYGAEGYIDGNRKYMKGESLFNWYMYQYAGVDRRDGRALYEFNSAEYDINDLTTDDYTVIDGATYTYKTTYARKDYSGSSIPKIDGSLTTSVRYKDFELSGLFTFQTGGKVFDRPYRSLMSISEKPSALHKDVLNAWSPEQAGTGIDPKGIPALNSAQSTDNNDVSSRFLVSSDYFAIKNVTFTYNIPKNLLNKVGIKGLLLSATGENLATFTKRRGLSSQQDFNGIISNQYPPARVFSLGLNLKF